MWLVLKDCQRSYIDTIETENDEVKVSHCWSTSIYCRYVSLSAPGAIYTRHIKWN
jgi:hypothetical protein